MGRKKYKIMKKVIYILLTLVSIQGFGQCIIDGTTVTGTTKAKTVKSCDVVVQSLSNGMVKSSGDTLKTAVAGTDYQTALFLSVKDFGAVGDGVTNDSAAFAQTIASAVSTGKKIFIPAGTYLVYNVALKSNVSIVGSGEGSVLKPRNSASQSIFTADSISDWSIQDVKLLGYNTTRGSLTNVNAITNQNNNGILMTKICKKWQIINCHLYGFKGYGIYWTNDNYANDTRTDVHGGMITNCTFEYSYCGAYIGQRAEYLLVTGNSFIHNTQGVYNIGGNNKFVNNSFNDSYYGFMLMPGLNNSHGSLIANDFNHCNTGLYIGRITNGEIISGNSFFTTKLVCDTSSGLNFTGNNFGSNDTITIDRASNVFFTGNYSAQGTAPVLQITNVTYFQAFNNFKYNGSYWEIYSNNYYWDVANNRLGLGTTTPSTLLDVVGNITAAGAVIFNPGTSQTFRINQNLSTAGIQVNAATGSNPAYTLHLNNTLVGTWGYNGTEQYHQTNSGTQNYSIYTGGTRNFRLFSNGNCLIQTGGTFTDNGYKLDVNGTGRFQNTLTATKFQLSALNTAPANAGDTGTTGEIRIDADYIYICTATNTWKRVAIATW